MPDAFWRSTRPEWIHDPLHHDITPITLVNPQTSAAGTQGAGDGGDIGPGCHHSGVWEL